MKKIILIITILTLISCSNNDNRDTTNPLKEKLKGSWKYEGYYDDVATDENPDGFYPTADVVNTIYNDDTFSTTLNGNPHESGMYTISTDSVLSHNNEIVGKIFLINDTKLIITSPHGYGAVRYAKN
jgi:hypothetical protein